jgi:hypothetical protein
MADFTMTNTRPEPNNTPAHQRPTTDRWAGQPQAKARRRTRAELAAMQDLSTVVMTLLASFLLVSATGIAAGIHRPNGVHQPGAAAAR